MIQKRTYVNRSFGHIYEEMIDFQGESIILKIFNCYDGHIDIVVDYLWGISSKGMVFHKIPKTISINNPPTPINFNSKLFFIRGFGL